MTIIYELTSDFSDFKHLRKIPEQATETYSRSSKSTSPLSMEPGGLLAGLSDEEDDMARSRFCWYRSERWRMLSRLDRYWIIL